MKVVCSVSIVVLALLCQTFAAVHKAKGNSPNCRQRCTAGCNRGKALCDTFGVPICKPLYQFCKTTCSSGCDCAKSCLDGCSAALEDCIKPVDSILGNAICRLGSAFCTKNICPSACGADVTKSTINYVMDMLVQNIGDTMGPK